MQIQSLVSTSSLTRRPSRLLSIGTKKKTKTRVLILTNNRLICLKVEKAGRVLTIRGEWAIPKVAIGKGGSNSEKLKPDKEKKKGKDHVNQPVISVEPKGEKEFVVLTVRQTPLLGTSYLPSTGQAAKSLLFVVEDSALRSKWVSNIHRALDPTTTSTPGA
jgi:hypothetical protein